jgi:hypothetical protein
MWWLQWCCASIGMATGNSPSGNSFPSPHPHGENFPAPVPVNAHRDVFLPSPRGDDSRRVPAPANYAVCNLQKSLKQINSSRKYFINFQETSPVIIAKIQNIEKKK